MFKWFEDRKEAKRLEAEKDALYERRKQELVTFRYRDVKDEYATDHRTGLSRLPEGFYFSISEIRYQDLTNSPYRVVTLMTPEGRSLGSRKTYPKSYDTVRDQKQGLSISSKILRDDIASTGVVPDSLFPDFSGYYPPNKL